MASLIESIGGSTRIIFAYDIQNASAHAYAEVYLGNEGTSHAEDILHWLRSEYNVQILPGINKTGGEIWLNLDWGSDPAKAAYPGGLNFGEGSKKVFREVIWETDQKVPPKIVPIIDTMDSIQGWETIKDDKGSAVNISSIPGKKGNAIQISYDLKEDGWVGISRQIDPKLLMQAFGLNFSYFSMGNQNTMELRFEYENETPFGISWTNSKTDAWSFQKALYTDFKCLDLRNRIGFKLENVRKIEFIISNHPEGSAGSGTMILDNVRGVMAISVGSPWARAEEERETA
jgi:hypothetical protein